MSKLPLFVHFIESPSSEDFLEERCEGNSLKNGFKLSDIKYSYNLVTDKETFYKALDQRLIKACKEFFPRIPVFHFSMHGNANCIALTNGDCITWNDLNNILSPINKMLNGNLLLCMSSCFGIYSFNMNYNPNIDLPIYGFVGSDVSVPWDESALAYATFYHWFFKGNSLDRSVQAMRNASDNQNFHYVLGQTAKNIATLNKALISLSGQNLHFMSDIRN